MNPVPTYVSIPTFGGSSTKVKPDTTTYSTGYSPGQGFPAQHENYFMNGLTANMNTVQTDLTAVENEIINLLAQYSITPNPLIYTQLRDLFVAQLALKLNVSAYTASDVLAKLLTVDTDTAGINATTLKSVTPGSGGLTALAKTATIWASDNDGAGSAMLSEGVQSSQITDMNFDPVDLSLATRESRVFTTSITPANRPVGFNYFTLQLSNIGSGVYTLTAWASGSDYTFTRVYASGAWGTWKTWNPYRTYNGGSVSGTVTLPSIEIGETMTSWYNWSANGTIYFPVSGTYNAVVLYSSGVYPATVRSGGTLLFTVTSNGDRCIIYTRTA